MSAGEAPARKGRQRDYSLHYINGRNWRQDPQDSQDRGLAWILQNRMRWQQWGCAGDVAATLRACLPKICRGGPDISVVIRYTTAPAKEVSANRTRLQPNII